MSSVNRFADKVSSVYDKIDRICEKICYLPGGVLDTLEQCKKNMSCLNAIVGVGTLLFVICAILSFGLYSEVLVLLGLLVVGAVLQYICYQMYSAMMPLLFGNKIKLSSQWLPRTLTLACVPAILGTFVLMYMSRDTGAFLINLIPAGLLLGVGYSCVNCTKLSVDLCPGEVVPGRELINLVRFIVRVVFTTVYVFTPVMMVLAALAILLIDKGNSSRSGIDALMRLASNETVYFALIISVLPIFTLPLYYLCSFIPDILESPFTRGDNK